MSSDNVTANSIVRGKFIDRILLTICLFLLFSPSGLRAEVRVRMDFSVGSLEVVKNTPTGATVTLDLGPGENLSCYGAFGRLDGAVHAGIFLAEGESRIQLVRDGETEAYLVKVIPAFNVATRCKRGQVQLTWTRQADILRYDVYRSTAADPENFNKIGTVAAPYAAYLDKSVTNEMTHLYAVAAVYAERVAFSAVASSSPSASRQPGNFAPVIYSTPPTGNVGVGVPFSYRVLAVDADGDALSYALSNAPEGMGISLDGLLTWTPGAAQIGDFSLPITVSDGKGGSVSQNIAISVSAPDVIVPDVVGMDLNRATLRIIDSQFQVGAVTQIISDTIPPGDVVHQVPAPGSALAPGGKIDLAVSIGSEDSTAPSSTDMTVAATLYSTTEFLYSGTNPVQVGVAPGTIAPRQAAVLRGKVRDSQGAPLFGVAVCILNHPEYGRSISREDGSFDMAVNGGGTLVVCLEKAGYFPVQRQAEVAWQDFTCMDEVILTAWDSQATIIDLASIPGMAVARGSVVADENGSRQAVLLVSEGTQAHLVMADGTTTPLSLLTLRATEYTQGADGARAMPAQLPPNSGYTYCVELSVDEAQAVGAKGVVFSRPLIQYLENFLDFPVGTPVPAGYYDREKGQWVAARNGRVVKIISIAGDQAEVDTDGDGIADDNAGISEAEQIQLASLYTPGTTLWRVPVDHFSAWDFNWPFAPPEGAVPPGAGDSLPEPRNTGAPLERCEPCRIHGASSIDCQTQTLGETVEVAGTAFTLNYMSDRAPGRNAAYTVNIPLTGESLPPNIKEVALQIQVAGRLINQTFSPEINLSHTFTWDGKDAYGRVVQGRQPATVRVGYIYDGSYEVPAPSEFSFGVSSGVRFSGNAARQEVGLWRENKIHIGTWDARGQGLGGWTLSEHHAYDPVGRILYTGDGETRSAQGLNNTVIDTEISWGDGYSGDEGPGRQALFDGPEGMCPAPDGGYYIADRRNQRVRFVDADDIIHTVAGTGVRLYNGDDLPAVEATLDMPSDVAMGPDGSLYIADSGHHRIRKVDSDGIIHTVAGTGNGGYTGNGDPAVTADIYGPGRIAVGPDGTIYFTESGKHALRCIYPNGIIDAVAGTGTAGFSGDNGPAVEAELNKPSDVAVGRDGSLFIADALNGRVRKVGTDGIITTVAGGGTYSLRLSSEGKIATDVLLDFVMWGGFYGSIDVDSHGNLFIGEGGGNRSSSYGTYIDKTGTVRMVDRSGIIHLITGGTWGYITAEIQNDYGYHGDSGPARSSRVCLAPPVDIFVAPDDSLCIRSNTLATGGITYGKKTIRRVSGAFSGFSGLGIMIAAKDGNRLYRFDDTGRHLQTVNTLTGSVVYTFDYDTNGRLSGVTDAFGNVTTIERDGAGNPTAIVAPFGQRTALASNAEGQLETLDGPENYAYRFTYYPGGLLESVTDPASYLHTFFYDDMGRLIQDEGPDGAVWELARTGTPDTYTVEIVTPEGGTKGYVLENSADGRLLLKNRFPDGTKNNVEIKVDGATQTEFSDGTQVRSNNASPDPRFGAHATYFASTTTAAAGRSQLVVTKKTATLTDPLDLMSLETSTETVAINSRTYTSIFDTATLTTTTHTPEARETATRINLAGQPVETRRALLSPVSFSYDLKGRMASITQGTRNSNFFYDGATGYLESRENALGERVSYTRDALGRVETLSLPDASMWAYSWGSMGNLTTLTEPGGAIAHRFTYSPVNLMESYTSPMGAVESFDYNLEKQLVRRAYPGGGEIQWQYNSKRQLEQSITPEGSHAFAYHEASGQLQQALSRDGQTIDYTYSGSLLTGVAWRNIVTGDIAYTYDNDFRVSRFTYGGTSVDLTYDDDGLLTGVGSIVLTRNEQNGLLTGVNDGGFEIAYTHTAYGEIESMNASQGASLFDAAYNYDDLGRIIRITEAIAGVGAHTREYGYDSLGRLITVTRDGGLEASYQYDAAGNRVALRNIPTGENLQPGDFVYDADHKLLSAGTTGFGYDPAGRLIRENRNDEITEYRYNTDGTLAEVSLPDHRVISYLHDARGRRIARAVNGVRTHAWLYGEGLMPIAEYFGSGALRRRFITAEKSTPTAFVQAGVTHHIISDHLGSPRLIVNDTGTVIRRIDYDAFGNVINDSNPAFDFPFGYAGGMADPDHALIRFGARDYHPATGRWTAKDPILFEGGLNLYGYVGEDPINRVDSKGLKQGDGLNFDVIGAMTELIKARKILKNAQQRRDICAQKMGRTSAEPVAEPVNEYFQHPDGSVSFFYKGHEVFIDASAFELNNLPIKAVGSDG